jgi:hypothetical protein
MRKCIPSIQYEIFCQRYVANHGDGRQAAIDAGFPGRNAADLAESLLDQHEIRERIDQLRQEQLLAARITADSITLELWRVAQNGEPQHALRALDLLSKTKNVDNHDRNSLQVVINLGETPDPNDYEQYIFNLQRHSSARDEVAFTTKEGDPARPAQLPNTGRRSRSPGR